MGFQCLQEAGELSIRQGMKERFEQDDALAQASVEIIVHGVEQLPIAFRVKGFAAGEVFDGRLETGIQFIDQIREDGDLVQELRFAGKKDLAEKVVEAGDTLTAGILKVCGVERGKIGSRTEMLGVLEHGIKQRVHGVSESATKSRPNGKDLKGFRIVAATTHAQCFIQVYTEHGVSDLQTIDTIQISVDFVASKWQAPILRHGAGVYGRRRGVHDKPPRSDRGEV